MFKFQSLVIGFPLVFGSTRAGSNPSNDHLLANLRELSVAATVGNTLALTTGSGTVQGLALAVRDRKNQIDTQPSCGVYKQCGCLLARSWQR